MTVRIAFVPLTDAAPIIVARELGYFGRRGIDVELSREQSWASIRDKIQTGRVDATQMLASVPLALSVGVTHARIEMATGLVLSLNGNGITVSKNLYEDLQRTGLLNSTSPASAGRALKELIDHRRALGKPRLCFASVYRTSTHYYLLRYWMAAAGIDTAADVRFVVIPPPRMVESLDSGLIDGCCVGEPWNHCAVYEGAGHVLLTGYDVWNNSPEKVLAVRSDWLDRNRGLYVEICRALIEAAQWIDQPENRGKVASILAQPQYVDVPEEVISWSLRGVFRDDGTGVARVLPDFHVFSRYTANFPWLSHAEWFLGQMQRWGQLPPGTDIARTARQVYRPDIYREAADGLGLPSPDSDCKHEGTSAAPYTGHGVSLGPNRYIDSAA